MINKLIGKVFGTQNEREIKKLTPRVTRINALEPEISALTDEQLCAKTDEFRKRIQDRIAQVKDELEADPQRQKEIEKERTQVLEQALDEILDEAFAVVREAASAF